MPTFSRLLPDEKTLVRVTLLLLPLQVGFSGGDEIFVSDGNTCLGACEKRR